MDSHFLVPLDGSRLAETVLPATLALARRAPARLTLLHILEQAAPATVHGDRHLRQMPEAETYLERLAETLDFPRDQISLEVHPHPEADVARSIFQHARELSADLVILSTHGYLGLRAWLFGSVPQKVLRYATPPVFMLQPTEAGTARDFSPGRAVVYLDGTPAAEAGLRVAEQWAKRWGMELTLLMCVPTRSNLLGARAAAGTLLPTTTGALLELTAQAAADQLQAHLARLQAEGINGTAQVVRGDPLTQLVEFAQSVAADVLCLTTRGESGLAALGTETIVPETLTRFNGAFLLAHAED